MDSRGIVLHYRNMRIPTYALYGEIDNRHEWLHWETIQTRARLHDYRIAPHRHEAFFQLLRVTGGRGSATLDGTSFLLKSGTIVLVPALTVHGYEFSRNIDGVVVTMMEHDLRELGIELPGAEILAETPQLARVLDGLLAESDHPDAQHGAAMRAHLTLLLVALHRGRSGGPGDGVDTSDRTLVHAQKFRHLVDMRYRQSRRISEYAAEIGISPTHLNRVCRQVLGASALEMIERRILLDARRQLMFSDTPVKAIGTSLGYDDPAYFTRFITRALGMAPSVFRQQGANAAARPPRRRRPGE